MRYSHDDYTSQYKYRGNYYGSDQDDDDGYGIFMFIVIFMFMGMLGVLVAFGVGVFKEPKQGYGGSPGHISPLEVEELYNKNRK